MYQCDWVFRCNASIITRLWNKLAIFNVLMKESVIFMMWGSLPYEHFLYH